MISIFFKFKESFCGPRNIWSLTVSCVFYRNYLDIILSSGWNDAHMCTRSILYVMVWVFLVLYWYFKSLFYPLLKVKCWFPPLIILLSVTSVSVAIYFMHLGVLMLGVYKFTIIILDELIFFLLCLLCLLWQFLT